MEENKSSQVMLATEKEVTIEDEATHVAAPEGEIFQLTYALQYRNICYQHEVIS